MADAELTATVDTSGLGRAIPQIVAFAKRTMVQQCVTSAAFICARAMRLTRATPLSRVDSDMGSVLSPAVLKNGELSRNKKKQHAVLELPGWTMADKIVLARTHPGSKFNRETGGRWALQKPEFSSAKFTRAYGESGSAMAKEQFYKWVKDKAVRMARARRSSPNFIKSGWLSPIRKLYAHPDFRGRKSEGNVTSELNPLNTLPKDMGDAAVTGGGMEVMVMASNDVGEPRGKSNAVLARKHREAAIVHALPAAQQAVNEEEQKIQGKMEKWLSDGLVPINKELA